MEFPSDTAAIYTNVYCDRSETPIGRVKFDPIKEEESEQGSCKVGRQLHV
jgi:hypothetical protein